MKLVASVQSIVAIMVAVGWLGGCCPTPTITPALGKSGPYVHIGQTTSSRTGLALPSAPGWPPPKAPNQSGTCADERIKLEADLGVISEACPFVQIAPVQDVGSGDDPIDRTGFEAVCYKLGSALLVVEYEHTGTLCTHVVGLAVFHRT